MSKLGRKAPKAKLKMMNKISAAEARSLCQAAMDPRARHLLECLKLWGEILSAGVINKRSLPLVLEELEAGSARAKGDVSDVSQTLAVKSPHLSPRECQIIELIRQNPNIRDKDISTLLHNSLRTVGTYMANLYGKFGVKNRTELAAKLPPFPPSNHT